MEIIQKPSPNFSSRRGRVPIAIVSHITSGQFPGCLSWLTNPASQASSNCLITVMGQIYQLVADENAAWANGIVNRPNWALYDGTNPNRYTLSIEHENLGGGQLTELQYQATLWLHKQWIQKWNIPINTDTIIGHYRIDSVNRPNCPGPNFPWQRLFSDLTIVSVNVSVAGQILQGVVLPDSQGNPRSFVPVRAIAQLLGFQYSWQGIDAENGIAAIGPYQVPVKIINNTGYAKVNDLCTAIGRQPQWDGPSNTVIIV